MSNRIQFDALERDLYCSVPCHCGSFRITGYADRYFFEQVNAKPKMMVCPKCGHKHSVQWFYDGVECRTWTEEEKGGQS